MTTQPTPEEQGPAPKKQGEWAPPMNRLNVDEVPAEATNLNVEGRKVTTPLQGFGQMWQKTYRIRFDGASPDPREVVRVWKEEFDRFWPEGNHFYGTPGPIRAGDVAVLNLSGPGGINGPGGKPLISTGILVAYADEVSFTFLTPQGHMLAGMNTFSAFEENGSTFAQVQGLIRASDPVYELMFRVGLGHKMEDDFWSATLSNLAARFGAKGIPMLNRVCVDPRLQWSEAKNIWHNAAIRTTLHTAAGPLRWLGRKLGGK